MTNPSGSVILWDRCEKRGLDAPERKRVMFAQMINKSPYNELRTVLASKGEQCLDLMRTYMISENRCMKGRERG